MFLFRPQETECQGLSSQLSKVQTDLDILKKREQEEELQVQHPFCINWLLKLNGLGYWRFVGKFFVGGHLG